MGWVNHKNTAMKATQFELRATQMEQDKLQLRVIDGEVDFNSIEIRYLPISSFD